MKTARFAAALGSSVAFVFFLGDADAGGRVDTAAVQAGNEASGISLPSRFANRDIPVTRRSASRGTTNARYQTDPCGSLKCGNATYRVRLVPDMAAHVERLD